MNKYPKHFLMAAFMLASVATVKASDSEGDKLLKSDQHAIDAADDRYKKAILVHGITSDEAVKANSKLDGAKNKLAADQAHVAQLQGIQGQPAAAVPAVAAAAVAPVSTTSVSTAPLNSVTIVTTTTVTMPR